MTIRPTRLSTTFYAGAALSLALGVALLATSLPAHAADDGASLDQKVFRGILEGLGLRKDGEAINYQERAPLVIPPGRTLPPPERADAALANNPAWPKDPDVIKRKRELEQERATGNKNSVDVEAQARVLRPDQLAPGGDSRKEGRRNQVGSNPTGWFGGERLTSSDLGYKGGLFSGMFGGSDEETAKFTNEPPRASLTAPPPGYQTPSPEQPYGLSGRTAAPKATNYSLEHGTHNN